MARQQQINKTHIIWVPYLIAHDIEKALGYGRHRTIQDVGIYWKLNYRYQLLCPFYVKGVEVILISRVGNNYF